MRNYFAFFLISISIYSISSRRHDSSSEESIENLLYYKDCQHKSEEQTTAAIIKPLKLRAAVKRPEPPKEPQPQCPFPRMCCSMTCGNECNQPSNIPFEPQYSMPRQQAKPVQPQINPMRMKKGKPLDMLPPIGGRRSVTYTKDKIKSLISQDDDIRKILKDLVRVTMQKVDLLEMINKNSNKIHEQENKEDGVELDYA